MLDFTPVVDFIWEHLPQEMSSLGTGWLLFPSALFWGLMFFLRARRKASRAALSALASPLSLSYYYPTAVVQDLCQILQREDLDWDLATVTSPFAPFTTDFTTEYYLTTPGLTFSGNNSRLLSVLSKTDFLSLAEEDLKYLSRMFFSRLKSVQQVQQAERQAREESQHEQTLEALHQLAHPEPEPEVVPAVIVKTHIPSDFCLALIRLLQDSSQGWKLEEYYLVNGSDLISKDSLRISLRGDSCRVFHRGQQLDQDLCEEDRQLLVQEFMRCRYRIKEALEKQQHAEREKRQLELIEQAYRPLAQRQEALSEELKVPPPVEREVYFPPYGGKVHMTTADGRVLEMTASDWDIQTGKPLSEDPWGIPRGDPRSDPTLSVKLTGWGTWKYRGPGCEDTKQC